MTELVNLFSNFQIQWILILIAIDVVLGIIGALTKQEFVLGKLGGFMKKAVVPYVLGFAVLSLADEALPALSLIVSMAYILIILALIGSILSNLKKLGLPIPRILEKE